MASTVRKKSRRSRPQSSLPRLFSARAHLFHLFLAILWLQSLGEIPPLNSGRYRLEKRAIVCTHGCCAGKVGVAHDGKWRCCAMQMTEIFTGDMTCKDNDRLVTMHTSDTRRSVWYKNK